MLNTEMIFCPGCKNGCRLDAPTCRIGAMHAAEQKKRKEAEAARAAGAPPEKWVPWSESGRDK